MNAQIDISNIILDTDRLRLRAFKLSDLDDLYEYASVPGVGELAGWSHHKDKEESLRILNMFIDGRSTFAICYQDKVIGSIGIDRYGMEDKLSEFYDYQGRELGFVLSKDYWGKGLMLEALQAVINYLFNDLNLDFLLCGHFITNNRSKRVQEKLGFKPYRRLTIETIMGTKEEDILNILINPNKDIKFNFSHLETLIFNN